MSKITSPAVTGLIVLALAACGSHDGDSPGQDTGTGGAASGSGVTFGGAPATGGAITQPAGGAPASAAAGGTSSSAGAPATAGGDLPCDVQSIEAKNCSSCHAATPLFGAPFGLTKAADFRAHGAKILERIGDAQKRMPPEPNTPLTTAEIATLTQYINSGAPASTCGAMGPGTTPVDNTPTMSADPSVTCYNLKARASAAGDKFTVPTTPDLYECFNYAPPWGSKKVQIVSTRPLIDNAQVLHHWLLYNGDAAVTDGSHSDCVGAHPNSALVAGWAPGGEPFTAPPDVGVQVSSGGFTMEIHYNNKLDAGQMDASGVEICVTDKLRPNVAAMHWLGTQNLNKQVATGTCLPTNTGDVTILRSSPHMHLQGRHMTTVINRAGGGTEMLIDKPFDFQTQVSYATPAVIHKGDTLTTTCTYATPTPFGQSTNQEMCYNFVLAYPAGGLAQAFSLLRNYDCTGLF